MKSLNSFEFTVRSMVVRGEKPTKGLEAIAAPNPNQMNRVSGFLADGTPVIVAQRPGKGGMDFNKLLGGKVFAVAADGVSPVYEKGPDNKPTKKQKVEDGAALYSSSGFYLLSSKDYPALHLLEAYTLLKEKGEQVLILTAEQVSRSQKHSLTSEMDFDLLSFELEQLLDDQLNLVTPLDDATNKKRNRGIERGKGEAEDSGEGYAGVEFKELSASKKDGNPFVYFAWRTDDGTSGEGAIVREITALNEDGRLVGQHLTPTEALQHLQGTPEYALLKRQLDAGIRVSFAFAQGHVMRTSVSFRRKVENVLAALNKPQYGDAVYIHAALNKWTKGLVALMQSQHPNFPAADYDAHHYVAACRQAEVGMNKAGDRWTPPVALSYDIAGELMA